MYRRAVRGALVCAGVVGGISMLDNQASAATNLLSDPSFETPVVTGDTPMSSVSGSAWQGWNNWTSPYSAYYTASVAEDGSQAAKTYSGPNAGVYQSVPVVVGDNYTASAWFLNNPNDAMTGTETDDVRIIFNDSTGAAIGAPVVSPATVTATTTQGVWTELTVTTTAGAPANAATVELMGFFDNAAGTGGGMYMDNASLVDDGPAQVPEPASLGVIGVGALALVRRRRQA